MGEWMVCWLEHWMDELEDWVDDSWIADLMDD